MSYEPPLRIETAAKTDKTTCKLFCHIRKMTSIFFSPRSVHSIPFSFCCRPSILSVQKAKKGLPSPVASISLLSMLSPRLYFSRQPLFPSRREPIPVNAGMAPEVHKSYRSCFCTTLHLRLFPRPTPFSQTHIKEIIAVAATAVILFRNRAQLHSPSKYVGR